MASKQPALLLVVVALLHPALGAFVPGQVCQGYDPAQGNFLATGGGSGVVHVWDRHGEHCYEISLTTTSPVSALEWDKDGDCLAILQEGQGLIPIWDMQYREVTRLDTALKDPSYMKWSRSGPQLVIGTAKGNVMVYNRHSRKKVNVLGKHPRRISCGAWSKDNRLALGSDDCTLTLSNEQGDLSQSWPPGTRPNLPTPPSLHPNQRRGAPDATSPHPALRAVIFPLAERWGEGEVCAPRAVWPSKFLIFLAEYRLHRTTTRGVRALLVEKSAFD